MLLYLLLTGRHPHRLEGLSPGQIEYILCHDEPSKPSTAVGKKMTIMQCDISVTQVTPEQIAQRRNLQAIRAAEQIGLLKSPWISRRGQVVSICAMVTIYTRRHLAELLRSGS